jgi:hypothetical protein
MCSDISEYCAAAIISGHILEYLIYCYESFLKHLLWVIAKLREILQNLVLFVFT